jgi:KipI family sensor histidine kinase inhibitor
MEVRAFGDAAFLVVVGDPDDPATLRRVHALASAVAAARTAGAPLGTPVPGIATLLVPFDLRATSGAEASERLADIVHAADREDAEPVTSPTRHRIAVRYGGEAGRDLDLVAQRLGIPAQGVIELHASVDYRVAILGFMPGFAYLGDVPEELRLPRRDSPRTRVPAGSVAIAGRRTAVYPFDTPGGWHLIGHTDTPLWRTDDEQPALLRPGDVVRFEPLA